MNTALSSSLSRSFLAAALAFAGTVVSFSATTSTAHASTNHYNAKLSAAVAAPQEKVVNDVVWKCVGDSCGGPIDGSRPVNTCVKVVKAFGKVQSFTGPKGEFSADDLARCNAAT